MKSKCVFLLVNRTIDASVTPITNKYVRTSGNPPNANISDLDQETRATINKMMFEQQEKEKQGFYKDLNK